MKKIDRDHKNNRKKNIIMQITKNQHYVPRFYMKPFSIIKNEGTKKEKVLISFYQFKDNLFRDNVPTTSVCSEDFFYDEDGRIENKLAEKENKWGSAILKINRDEELAASEINDIREFTVYQISRTKAMLDHNQDMATTMLTNVLYNQTSDLDKSVIKEIVEKKVETEITSEYNLDFVKDTLPIIDDLKMCILENKTDVAFLTSDVPVIIVNPLGVHRAGLGNIGTVVFFPTSQKKMVMFYDNKLYGKIAEEIQDSECINAFNKYQYISADERILALNSIEFERFTQDKELNTFREKFHVSAKTTTSYDGIGTFMAAKSRSIEYYFDIPILKLPKSLKKIPRDFRETYPRKYSYETRRVILCKIYREPDFIKEEKLKNHWRQMQQYAKVLLKYLDYYWNTPKEDCVISGEFMRQLKEVPVNFFPQENCE